MPQLLSASGLPAGRPSLQDLSLLELSLGRAPGHSEAGVRTRIRPPSYARRQERRRAAKVVRNANKAADTASTSVTISQVDTAEVKGGRGC